MATDDKTDTTATTTTPDTTGTTGTTTTASTTDNKDSELIAKIVQEKLDASLVDIKGKLDNAFAARDEALRKVAEFEAKEKEANIKRLEEEGKHKEVFELKLAEERAAKEVLAKKVTELSRDVSVRDALKGFSFRNDNASEMAYREIIGQLVQNEQGSWVHRSGVSIKEFAEAFSKGEEHSFLFKPKASSGAGTTQSTSTASGEVKSLFQLPQADVLKMAAEGKFGTPKI